MTVGKIFVSSLLLSSRAYPSSSLLLFKTIQVQPYYYSPAKQLLSRRSSSSLSLSLSLADRYNYFLKSHQSKSLFSTTMTTGSSSSSSSTMNRGGTILRASSEPNVNSINSNGKDGNGEEIGLKQLFDDESSTYTYLLWDTTTKDAIIIDPVLEQVDRDLKEISNLDLNLIYALNTHAHADHVTGTGLLKIKLAGSNKLQSIISKSSDAQSDIQLNNGDKIIFGSRQIEALTTPGHTLGCMCYVLDDLSYVFTGDTLLIQGCGRTDFQGGSSITLWDSVHDQLFNKLPDTTIVYPAHDYKGRTSSSIGIEKETNPRLGIKKTKTEFVDIMKNLNLSYPKKIDIAVPANMRCGIPDVE